jgi:hypothetical protein
VIIDQYTDLTALAGKSVTVSHTRTARIQTIHHGAEATLCVDALRDGVWGDCWYERHGDSQGGNSSFWWPYGTDVEVQP